MAKKILVTGGSGGIGRSIVKALVQDGFDLIVIDRCILGPRDKRVVYIEMDLTDVDRVNELDRYLGSDVGEIYGLVNLAAIAEYGSLREMPIQRWENVLRVNLWMPILLVQVCDPYLAKGGRIILFGSGTAFKGPSGLAVYAATKAGVIGFGRSMAAELGDRGITVNTVCPGFTNTTMSVPIKELEDDNIATRCIRRREEPEDLTGTVRFLLSNGASFITGQTICVDGGSVRR